MVGDVTSSEALGRSLAAILVSWHVGQAAVLGKGLSSASRDVAMRRVILMATAGAAVWVVGGFAVCAYLVAVAVGTKGWPIHSNFDRGNVGEGCDGGWDCDTDDDFPAGDGATDSDVGTTARDKRTQTSTDTGILLPFLPVVCPSWDKLFVLLLTLCSLRLRCCNLSHPNHLLFDEVHFGKFVNNHIKGTWYYDIHPPLVKLMMAWFLSTFAGYDGNQSFISIGQRMLPTSPLKAFRFIPALASSLIVPAVYGTSRAMGVSRWGAITSSLMFLLDNLVVCEGRMLTTDTSLLLFITLSFMTHTFAERCTLFSPGYFFWNTLCGFAMGATLSTKWTGLSVFGVVGISTVVDLFRRGHLRVLPLDAIHVHPRDFLCRLAMLLGIPVIIYVVMFYLWFLTCPKAGSEMIHMPRPFLASLEGSKLSSESLAAGNAPPGFWQNFFDLNKSMFVGNKNILAPHHWQSFWYTWPLCLRGLNCWYSDYYVPSPGRTTGEVEAEEANEEETYDYQGMPQEPVQQHVYFLGNPLVWWLAFACLPCGAFVAMSSSVHGTESRRARQRRIHVDQARRETTKKIKSEPGGLKDASKSATVTVPAVQLSGVSYVVFKLYLGYFASILPYVAVRRSCFIYHYMPSLFFAVLLAGVVFDHFVFEHEQSSLRFKVYFLGLVVATISWSFWFFAPLTYGTPLTVREYESRIWVDPGWR